MNSLRSLKTRQVFCGPNVEDLVLFSSAGNTNKTSVYRYDSKTKSVYYIHRCQHQRTKKRDRADEKA